MVDDGGWVCVALYIRIKALSLHKKLSSVVIIMIVTSWAMGTSSNDAYLHNHLQWCWCFYCSLRWTSESPSGGNLLLPFTWLDNTHTLCAPIATHNCTHECNTQLHTHMHSTVFPVQMPVLCIKRLYNFLCTQDRVSQFFWDMTSAVLWTGWELCLQECSKTTPKFRVLDLVFSRFYTLKEPSIVKRFLVQLEFKTNCWFALFLCFLWVSAVRSFALFHCGLF